MENLKSLWRGNLRLGDAFWTWAVLGGLLINVSTTIAFLGLITADHPLPALMVGYAISIPYNIIALVGVWRAAARHGGPVLHADMARWASLIFLIVLSVT